MKTKTPLMALCLPLLVAQIAFSAPLKDLPGAVPLQSERNASSDLVYNGQILLPDEARDLVRTGKVTDLSLLNPDETSALWKNTFLLAKDPRTSDAAFNDLPALGLNESGEEVQFLSESPLPSGRVGFVGQKKLPNGQLKTYQFLLDLKGHNILLRKALLRKIGYQIPATDRLATVKVRFNGASSKREFYKNINRKTFVESSRWVTSNPDTDDAVLTMQDVIVIEGSDDSMYHLARGTMSSSVIKGRRLMSALLLPFSMTDSPESVNLMNGLGGQIFNDQLRLPHEDGQEFWTSYEDARWILRRMLKLDLADWEQITRAARVPTEVSAILKEKLVSRRNFLRTALKMDNESQELPVISKLTIAPNLVEGLIKKIEWPGYARHFGGAEVDSPLSRQELLGLFRSKSLSLGIDNLVSFLNTNYMLKTDLGWEILDRQLDLAASQLAHYIATKEIKKVPMGFWAIPYFDTNLIGGRDLIMGNYMGSENAVQLADTVGFAAEVGEHFQGKGFPSGVSVSARAKLFWVKTYTHLKPLASIKAANKQPLRNLAVPYLKSQAAQPLEKILALESQQTILAPEELQKQIKANMDEFDKTFGAGESLMITNSIGPEFNLNVARGFHENAQIFARMQEKLTDLNRVHIYRKDAKIVQVYFDPGLYNTFGLGFGLNAVIPVFNMDWDWKKGSVRTHFFDFSLNSNLEENPRFFEQIAAISAVLRGADLKYLQTLQRAWEIDHDFSDKSLRGGLLMWRFANANTRDIIRVTHPSGQHADYVRRLRGTRTGREFESLIADVANALLAERKNGGVRVSGSKTDNPANTLLGKSVGRQTLVEAKIGGNSFRADDLYASVQYTWRGSQIKKADAEKILAKLSKQFGQTLFPTVVLNDTQKVLFYGIDVQISLYQRAFEKIVSLSENEIRQLFQNYNRKWVDPVPQIDDSWANAVVSAVKGMKAALQKNDASSRVLFVDNLSYALDIVENQLSFEGLKAFVGGEQNMFVRGTIRGHRLGAEDARQDIQGQTIGQIGSTQPFGPLDYLQRQMTITNGEFLLGWLLNTL